MGANVQLYKKGGGQKKGGKKVIQTKSQNFFETSIANKLTRKEVTTKDINKPYMEN